MEILMRAHDFFAIAAVIIIGFVLKQFLFEPPKAEAQNTAVQMDMMQMHRDHAGMRAMKVDRTHDMQTVFPDQE
jgi:hypothetical protein